LREIVVLAWSAAETVNDIKLLENGENVALFKNPRQWAVTLTGKLRSMLESRLGSEEAGHGTGDTSGAKETGEMAADEVIFRPEDTNGMSYQDYLRMFLWTVQKQTKLLRTMDLIQINLKSDYYGEFLIREHYVGIDYEVMMNGDKFSYTQLYFPEK
jgi:hypothetical protein